MKRCTPSFLGGVAGGAAYLLHKAVVCIGSFRLECPLAWAQREDVPMLLGRAGVFDRLAITFDGPSRRVTFRG